MSSVLVTGGTGFLGSRLVRALVARGDMVRILARQSSDLSRLAGLDVDMVRGDVRRPETLTTVADGVEVVYHLAGVLGRFGVPWEVYHGVHVDGTRNVLCACEGRRLERFVLCSSPGMLGTLAPGEPPRDESAEHRPVGFYERSKSEAENAALSLAVELDIPLVIARPEFVYGPGDRHVLGLFRAVQGGRFFYIGSGDCLCHPSYIDDVVAGLMACATGRASPQQAYHICGPRPLPLREFVGAIADALGVKAPRLHLPKPLVTAGAWAAEIAAGALGIEPPLTREGIRFFTGSRAFCTDKGRRDLGWSPRVDPVEGVQRAVDWYRAQGWL